MLPHVDEFRPVHNLQSLRALVEALSGRRPRSGGDPEEWQHEQFRRRPGDRRPAGAPPGETVALATVVETWGSSPRPAGAQLAVSASGKLAGSVSGGCIEGAVADAAKQTMRDRRAAAARFRHFR